MARRILLAAVAGLALAGAFEPTAWAWTIPFAVAGFVLATRGLSARRALLPGLVFGVAFYFTLTVWMRTVGTDAWIGMAAFMSLFYAVLGAASAVLQRLRLWPVWVACAWVTVEVWRSGWPFSGMPWGNLSFGVVDTPVADALPYVGAQSLSLLLALLGALLALAWVRWREPAEQAGQAAQAGQGSPGRPWQVAVGPALVGAAVLAGLLSLPALLPWQGDSAGEATIAVVQGDVPGPGNDILFDYQQVTRNHVDATVDLARRVAAGEAPRPDLVLWPENSTAVDPFANAETHAAIEEASAAADVPILVGAIADGGPGHVLNQGIVWDPVTGAGDRYTKRHPVVFGEYIPYRSLLSGLQIGRLDMVGRDMLPGTRREPLDVGGLRVGDAICFDVAYDDVWYDQVDRGAELMVVQTSNVSFMGSHQLDQQFAMTRLRAIETGRWVAVASPNGISGVIAPDGRVVQQADKRTTDVLVQQVGLAAGVPPAVRLGAWPGRLAVLVTVVALGVALLPYRRRRQPGHPTPDAVPDAPTALGEREPA